MPLERAPDLLGNLLDQVLQLLDGGGAERLEAQRSAAAVHPIQKQHVEVRAADALLRRRNELLAANARDVQAATRSGMTSAMLDRLRLDAARIESMAAALDAIVQLPDPIYESRPNVTADAGGLCLKSGNAVILRGGSESQHSNVAIHACLLEGLDAAQLPQSAIQLVPTTDRAAVGHLLASMADYVDVIVPRGGKSLIERVQKDARVPVIGHLEGNCHVYVDRDANLDMARTIVVNAKMRRTGICGAAETVLIDRGCAKTHLAPIVTALFEAGCEVRGDSQVQKVDPRVKPASEDDWYTEYLDAVIAARVVDGVDAAIEHIHRYGSSHTESIVTENKPTAEQFLARVDGAIVLHNASTQFADGGEFGMGAEIGISTDKFHARGPVGVEQLTSYKYVVRGAGQVRP
ncbi:MAG: glutamate-5-semialdehyde dehydrogenase [Gammaproteobacteria bacterium]